MTARQVVVGVDGSAIAVRALDRAAEEAVRRGAALEIVYAVPDIDEAGPVLASSASRARGRHPGLEVTTAPVTDDAVGAILRRGRDAALTVVGSRGLGGFAGPLVGSVSLRLAAHAQGPLLVVRGDRCLDRDVFGFGDVLLGLEGDADIAAAAYAFEEAARRGARLRILHTWTRRQLAPAALSPTPPDRVQDAVMRQARTEAALPGQVVGPLRQRYPQVGVETRTLRSGPAHSLVEETREADVVVIAAHRRAGRLGPQLGPVTHALLHRSHCPVILVPVPA